MRLTVIGNKIARWRALCRIVLFLVVCPIVLAVTSTLTSTIPGFWRTFALGVLASLCTFALTLLFVRWEKLRLEDVGAALLPSSLRRFGLGFFGGLLLVALVNVPAFAAGNVHWVAASPDLATAAMMLITFIALSCREELGFHGYLLRQLDRIVGLWSAQLIIALVFAIEHWMGGMPWSRALLGPVAGSLLFGVAAIATRGLAIPIGLHAAWNFGDWVLGWKEWPGMWKAVIAVGQEQRTELARTISFLAVFGAATLAFWLWHRRKGGSNT